MPTAGLSAYRGRFAPSPTGPLHAGSLVAALASWLDARAQDGTWLVRIEDVDTPRCVPGAAELILQQLATCGLVPDEPPVFQSRRGGLYTRALEQLVAQGLAYPCGCTRQDIARAQAATGQKRSRHEELVYPGTCRDGLHGKPARAWRFRSDLAGQRPAGVAPPAGPESQSIPVAWHDRRMGDQLQDVESAVGDFVLHRADGLWAYQLAVVVDDAEQRITHVVRGADLADNTARQILLQHALALPTPFYMHVPLVMGANGEKLSKQNGAQALVLAAPLAELKTAGTTLGLRCNGATISEWLCSAVEVWRDRQTKNQDQKSSMKP
ncbi:MAG: tRNA glutamyl-Q(34) synthetase GluQRS [Comamonadaceae bacterium]|nr:MAG: tRNA glutamyl-Q(34) synthetase GluQRS [Comamonadaceae bacterium]